MKKYLLLVLLANLLMAEDLEVNKEVKGVNQKTYTETGKINNDKKEINTGNIKLIEVGKGTAGTEPKDKASVNIIPKESIGDLAEVTPKDDLFFKKERESRVFFGLGGHDSVSNYNYGIVDNARIDKYGVDYNLLIKRDTSEENRDNSKLSSDLLNIIMKKEKVTVGLNIEKGTQEFPGMSNAIAQVKSDKEFSDFGTEIAYELTADTSINFDYNYNGNISESVLNPGYTRNYKYSTYELNGVKEIFYKDDKGTHSINAKLGIIREENEADENRNILYVEGKDRFNLVKISNVDFNTLARVEGGENTNLSLDLEASKKLDENIKINAALEIKSDYKLKKDIINEFSYVKDIVDYKNLENEKIYTLLGGMTYTKGKLYAALDASINSGKDMIAYEAVEVSTGLERAIVPTNYDKSLVWLETNIKTSYTMDENLRGEANLNLSSLNDLAYTPGLKASLEGIYTKNRYEGRAKLNFNGSMYSKNKGAVDRESLDSYETLDILNSYTFGNDYSVSFNINNLLDNNREKMKGYAINGRVVSLGFEIKY